MWSGPEMMAVVMAGAEDRGLMPLTQDRAKAAIPFGAIYRVIDFPLSNCFHSGLRHVLITVQYRSNSLVRHVETAWKIFVPEVNGFIQCSPPQRVKDRFYQGTADALYQNLFRIRETRPEAVLTLSGGHLYRADFRKLFAFHKDSGAEVTLAALPMPLARAAGRHDVLSLGEGHRVLALEQKPDAPAPMPGDPSRCLVSMGIVLFQRTALEEVLELGPGQDRQFDLAHDLLPALISSGARVRAWPFEDENDKPEPYWRDVGTIEGYYEANMDLVQPTPHLNLYDRRWPILSQRRYFLPPAKFVWNWHDNPPHRIGRAVDSIVSPGVIVSGGLVERCVVGPEVRVNSYATVTDSILFDGVHVGRHAQIRRTIVDKDVSIPEGARVGYDLEEDRKRFTVSDTGIVVIPKGHRF
jgi:glucose-1-phosphate adenylyltransferase